MEETTVAFEMIAYAGDAMNCIMEAMDSFANHQKDQVEQHLKDADQFMQKAHKLQTDLIFKECNGKQSEVNLVMVHAQDHLMNAMLAKQLVVKMMEIFSNYTERTDER